MPHAAGPRLLSPRIIACARHLPTPARLPPAALKRNQQHRSASGTSGTSSDSAEWTPRWIVRLNSTLKDYPGPSFVAYLGTGLATFGAANLALTAMHFDLPALAVGGVVSKLSKKLRMPLDLSLAAALSHAVPAANALKLGPLLAAPLPPPEPTMAADADVGAPTRLESLAADVDRRIVGLVRWAEGPVNQYGGPYVFVHWASGLSTCLGTTLAISYGVDVAAMLRHLPFLSSLSESTAGLVSGKASCLAGAMLINTLSLPLRIYLMSVLARPAFVALAAWRDSSALLYRSHLRQQIRAFPETFPRRLELRSAPRRGRRPKDDLPPE